MSRQYVFDVETAAVESTAVVLSAAITWFDPEVDTDVTYEVLCQRCLFVKFDGREQMDAGRIVERSTLDWWKKQGETIRKMSFLKSDRDVGAVQGLNLLKEYVKEADEGSFIWARGSLDQLVIESLARTFEQTPFFNYNKWMDVRTFIRSTKDSSTVSGYCDFPGKATLEVEKHNPIADVALDAIQLIHGV